MGSKHYVVVSALLIVVLFALWRTTPDANYDSAKALAVLEEADALRGALLHSNSTEELDGISFYRDAMRSIDRAKSLTTGSEPSGAMPHAQSAVALFERTEETIQRTRFHRLETRVIALQLDLVGSVDNGQRLEEADAVLRAASEEAVRGNWGAAMNQLKLAEMEYRELSGGGE